MPSHRPGSVTASWQDKVKGMGKDSEDEGGRAEKSIPIALTTGPWSLF